MASITTFLTPESEPIFYKVLDIVQKLESNGIQFVVFGGFIRDIIKHYYESDKPFVFNDINVWVLHQYYSKNDFKKTIYRYVSKIDSNAIQILNNETTLTSIKININGIIFDFCTNSTIMLRHNHDIFIDFTINNLAMNSDCSLTSRIKTEYSIDDIIQHIMRGYLIEMEIDVRYILQQYGENFYYYDDASIHHLQKYFSKKIEERKLKMMEKGFQYISRKRTLDDEDYDTHNGKLVCKEYSIDTANFNLY
jgi:hypothetical protein